MSEYAWARETLPAAAPLPTEEELRRALEAADDPFRTVQILAAYRILRDPDRARRWEEEERRLAALPAELRDLPLARDLSLCLDADPATQGRLAIQHRPWDPGIFRKKAMGLLKQVPQAPSETRARLLRYLPRSPYLFTLPGRAGKRIGITPIHLFVAGGILMLALFCFPKTSKLGELMCLPLLLGLISNLFSRRSSK